MAAAAANLSVARRLLGQECRGTARSCGSCLSTMGPAWVSSGSWHHQRQLGGALLARCWSGGSEDRRACLRRRAAYFCAVNDPCRRRASVVVDDIQSGHQFDWRWKSGVQLRSVWRNAVFVCVVRYTADFIHQTALPAHVRWTSACTQPLNSPGVCHCRRLPPHGRASFVRRTSAQTTSLESICRSR